MFILAYNQYLMKARSTLFRPTRTLKSDCDRHSFSLRPRNDYVVHPHRLSLSFCQPENNQNNKTNTPNRSRSCLNCPILNQDRSHASPAFILRSEKAHYEQKKEELKLGHELKIRHYQEEKSEMNLPKPKSSNNYCSVCHVNYDDYLNHTTNPFHLDKLRKSAFNPHILQLVEKVNRTTDLQRRQKRLEITEISDSVDVEIIENPRKRIKADDNQMTAVNQSPITPSPSVQGSSVLNWLAQAPLPSTREMSELYSQQVALGQYISMFSNPFPLISPIHPQMPIIALQTLTFPIFTLPQQPQQQTLPKPPPCIIIDD